MLVRQPCPSPFDIENPIHFEIKFIFGKALANALGPCQKRDTHNEISYWWAELDGIPVMLRMDQNGKCFITYDANDARELGTRLNLWIEQNVIPVVTEIPPKVIRRVPN